MWADPEAEYFWANECACGLRMPDGETMCRRCRKADALEGSDDPADDERGDP
jgi:hypothetical protein